MNPIPLVPQNERVYDQEGQPLPPHPGVGWTRFVCISDTHARRFALPAGDVLLHSGDLSSGGSFQSLKKTLDWLATLDHPVKIITAGNHDMCLDSDWDEGGRFHQMGHSVFPREDSVLARAYVHSERLQHAGIRYLQHEACTFTSPSRKVWKVYGSPAAQVFSLGAFQYGTLAEARELYEKIPQDTEILLTHTPPHGVLDTTRHGNQVGCQVLSASLKDLSNCRLHVFGHIHEGHGSMVTGDANPDGNRKISVNGALGRWGGPIVVDLKD